MVKKILFALIILTKISFAYSQIEINDIGIETRYPITMGENFLNNNEVGDYNGIIDFGLDVNILKKNNFNFGILFNISFLSMSETNLNLSCLSPKLKVDYLVDFESVQVIPQFAIGYSRWMFQSKGTDLTDEYNNQINTGSYKENKDGITLKASTKIVINGKEDHKIKLYFLVAYEFTRLQKSDEAVNSDFNRNLQLLYPGIGIIWKIN